jgi:hypothetical protein
LDVRLVKYSPIMTRIVIEAGIIFVLLLANGVFAMAEISIAAARKNRLRQSLAGATLAPRSRSSSQRSVLVSENWNLGRLVYFSLRLAGFPLSPAHNRNTAPSF